VGRIEPHEQPLIEIKQPVISAFLASNMRILVDYVEARGHTTGNGQWYDSRAVFFLAWLVVMRCSISRFPQPAHVER
jgi:hypothetical protein